LFSAEIPSEFFAALAYFPASFLSTFTSLATHLTSARTAARSPSKAIFSHFPDDFTTSPRSTG